MKPSIWLFAFVFASSALAGPLHSGKSEAQFNPEAGKPGSGELMVKNTEYRFDQYSVDTPGPGAKFTTATQLRLYEIKSELSGFTRVEDSDPNTTVTAFDAVTDKKLWSIEDKISEFRPVGQYFVARTAVGGDCETSYRLYNLDTGKYLAAYSFAHRDSHAPVVLRGGAFRPEAFRFIAYHDAYWPCRDRGEMKDPPKKLDFAGVITYASPEKVLQKIAVFYVNDDPSSDPDSIELSYKTNSAKFTGPKGDSPHEFQYWWRADNPGLKPDALGTQLFSHVQVKFTWDKDVISLPLENDRLAVDKAKPGARYKKLVEIPEKDWDKF
ncbi:MAG: hypothetical protein ACXVB9_05775 [Bdellovibrionota bacterium]